MALPENKKQLYHCISVIRNRTSIPLNTTSEQLAYYYYYYYYY